VQREETFPIIEGSGSFHPQRQDKAVMRLREWKLRTSVSMCLLSLQNKHNSYNAAFPTPNPVEEEKQSVCSDQ
jgi:hypothetical protein